VLISEYAPKFQVHLTTSNYGMISNSITSPLLLYFALRLRSILLHFSYPNLLIFHAIFITFNQRVQCSNAQNSAVSSN